MDRRAHASPPSLCCLLQISRESTDEFVGRQAGYLMLYAAAMQVGKRVS